MPVAITQTADPAGVAASSTIATYTGASIGTADNNRVVVVLVGTELAAANASACTIDGVAMNRGSTLGDFAAMQADCFWLHWPSGTTAEFKVTFSATSPDGTQNHIAVYKVTGGVFSASGGDDSTDMDTTSPLTTGSITIASNGGFIAVAAGAADAVAKTWANATEDLDVDAGGFRFTTATRTTSGTVTVTCTGGTNNEDGALSYLLFIEGTNFIATGITATPDIPAATLTQAHVLTATGITATPDITSATLTQKHGLTATGITTTPDVSDPVLTQQHSLTATGVTATPDVTTATLTQAHALTATGLTATPVVPGVGLTQAHALTGTGVTVSPQVGAPALTETGSGVDNLTAVDLTLGAPTLEAPILDGATDGGAQFGPIHRLRRSKGLKYVKAKRLTDAIREALEDIETIAERAQAKVETELREQEESERLVKAAGDAAYADAYAKGLEDAKAVALEAGKAQAEAIRKEYQAAVVEAERAQERLRAVEAQEDDDEAMFVVMKLLEAA